MCFNAALAQSAEIIREIYGAAFPEEQFDVPSYFRTAFDHPRWPILKQGRTGNFVPAIWGLIPSWTKSASVAAEIRDKTINARFESLSVKPSFRGGVNRRRCAVLVDGFVEWRTFSGKKYPYHIALPDKRPFMLAGLWDCWKDPQSDTEIETFTVVTVTAEGLPAQIHNEKLRMPLILGKESGPLWLDDSVSFPACSSAITPVYRPLTAWPVSRDVSLRGTDKNRPSIQDLYEYPELPPLEPVDPR